MIDDTVIHCDWSIKKHYLPINKGNTNSFIDNVIFDIDDRREDSSTTIINAILCINEIGFILDHWKKGE